MDKIYEHHMLVRQEHLNQYGSLFGGAVLATIDELAFIACLRTFPGRNFVTRAIDNAVFDAAAVLGDLLVFTFHVETIGTTSVTVHVRMTVCHGGSVENSEVGFNGMVVMVCVNEKQQPVPVN